MRNPPASSTVSAASSGSRVREGCGRPVIPAAVSGKCVKQSYARFGPCGGADLTSRDDWLKNLVSRESGSASFQIGFVGDKSAAHGGYTAGQLVIFDVQASQELEAAEFQGKVTAQLIVGEVELI